MYQPPAPPPLRSGMTFEANLGLGWIFVSADNDSETSDLGIGGLCLGVGGWISPKVAITARLAGVTLSENGQRFSDIFLGPAAQYWIDDHFWLGGGAGFAILAVDESGGNDSLTGFGLDLRAGYSFTTGSENTFNASFELTPGFFDEFDSSVTFTGVALMLGYQHL